MKLSFIGLGKLGYPIASALSTRGLGYQVVGYDLKSQEEVEANSIGVEQWFDSAVQFAKSTTEAVKDATLIFVAVETPHGPRLSGEIPVYSHRADFDYQPLKAALQSIQDAGVTESQRVVVMSTVLPRTMDRLNEEFRLPLLYNPSFIAMGTTIHDFLNPEFEICGKPQRSPHDFADPLDDFYRDLTGLGVPFIITTFTNAEIVKMGYNAHIGQKIALANTLGEMCHKIPGANVDTVTNTLAQATRRIVSPAYTRAGMGDGGGCHPRDNIALSWLARDLDLHADPFADAILARQEHASWLAALLHSLSEEHSLPIAIKNPAYKRGVSTTTGSHALLVAWFIGRDNVTIYSQDERIIEQHVVLAANEPHRLDDYADGCVILDPWRTFPATNCHIVIPIGVGSPLPQGSRQ